MGKPIMVLTAVAVCAFNLTEVLTAQESPELQVGPWRVTLGEQGPEIVRYDDTVLMRHGRFYGYAPGWKGTLCDMQGAQLEVGENVATWRKQVPNVMLMELSMRVQDDALSFAITAESLTQGVSEFSTQIEPDAVRCGGNRLYVWRDGRPSALSLDVPVDQLSGWRTLSFETPERSFAVRTRGALLQDRRAAGSGLFLVSILSHGGSQPAQLERTFSFRVTPYDPDQREGRRVILAQTPAERQPLDVVNGDFEGDALRGWSENPHASVDAQVGPHTGRQCVRMVIEKDVTTRGHAYLIQQVPVRAGRTYQLSGWVKTDGVTSFPVGGMSPTGATVIVEFADKQGGWLASGNYAKGLYGTQNWRRLTTTEVRAPDQAGYAIVYLALRGLGTAWFDDIALVEVKHHAVMLAPAPGEMVRDNTPCFEWSYGGQGEVTVELSRESDFGAGALRRAAVKKQQLQWLEPLEPGVWHWRIFVEDTDYRSPSWSFTQTEPADRDCSEPTILESSTHLAEPREPWTVQVHDNVGVATVTVTSVNHKVALKAELSADHVDIIPETTWPEGLVTVDIQVKDAAGNQAARRMYAARSPSRVPSRWLIERGIEQGNRRAFPVGLYGVRIEDMPRVAAAGFTLVHNYSWDGSGTDDAAIEYLDAAEANGLQAFIGFSRSHLMANDLGFVAERTAALMGHPALAAWYLYDEPDLPHQHVDPQTLAAQYRLIKALDPFHPVILTCAYDGAVKRYRHSGDVYWTQVYGSTAFGAKRLPKHRADLQATTAHAAICHCYDRTQSGVKADGGAVDPAAFKPDAATMRANAFMSLVHGSSGLLWWWYGQGSPRSYTVSEVPWAWNALTGIVREIRSLEPLLTAEADSERTVLEFDDGGQVHVLTKTLLNRVLVIAVNRETRPGRVALGLPAGTRDGGRDVLMSAAVQAKDRELFLNLEPLGVRALVFPHQKP